ncbi:class I SAM-dependent methyltransferase [Agrilactobacillus fermenti]|uniref:class I SAM-dependent methyltransferase n=1 Tax=Agrilactobacillus fermenti TaxID=2586909 RepID=UPI003A5C1228
MTERPVKRLFDLLDQSTEFLRKDLNTTYLDALAENLGNILDHKNVKVENERPTSETIAKIKALYQKLDLDQFDLQTRRQTLQLLAFKGIQTDKVEPNKQITPDAIGALIAFLVDELTALPDQGHVFDIAVGSGNLILTVMQQLQQDQDISLQGIGIDNDDLLLELAAVFSQWLLINLDLYHQDAIMPVLAKDVDLVVSDLPVGYYPIDANTKNFKTRAKSGHAYVHHLMIEQSIHALKAGGLGFFVIPTTIFQSDEAKQLTEFLTTTAYFQGLLNLPAKLFRDEASRKSILIVQKHGSDAQQVGQVLLGDLPDFNDKAGLQKFRQELIAWRQKYFSK